MTCRVRIELSSSRRRRRQLLSVEPARKLPLIVDLIEQRLYALVSPVRVSGVDLLRSVRWQLSNRTRREHKRRHFLVNATYVSAEPSQFQARLVFHKFFRIMRQV